MTESDIRRWIGERSFYTFGFVWIGFIFLLEPINIQLGIESPLGEWRQGDPRPALRLMGAGMIAGFLWEFWNFWAASGWRYTVPWPLDFGVYYFRMPVLGLLGFPPFAWESWACFNCSSGRCAATCCGRVDWGIWEKAD